MHKRTVRRLFVLVFMILVAGCSGNSGQNSADGQPNRREEDPYVSSDPKGKNETGKKSDNPKAFWPYRLTNTMVTEEFAFLPPIACGARRFFDVASGQDVVYCFEPNCEHHAPHYDVASRKMLDDTCTAYHLGERAFFLQKEAGYYYSDPCLYRTDREGRSQKVIAKIEEPLEHRWEELYTQSQYVLTYTNDYEYRLVQSGDGTVWVPGETVGEKREAGVVMVSLTDGKYSFIYRSSEQYSSWTENLYEYDGHLYFDCHYLDVSENSLPSIIDDYEKNIVQYREEYKKHIHYEIYDCDLTTGEIRMILKVDHPVGEIGFGEGFFFVFADYNYPEYPAVLYRMDGSIIRELTVPAQRMAMSDGPVVVLHVFDNGVSYYLYDTETDEILNRMEVSSYGTFDLVATLGDSYYGNTHGKDGLVIAWIRKEDFWNREFSKAVKFDR